MVVTTSSIFAALLSSADTACAAALISLERIEIAFLVSLTFTRPFSLTACASWVCSEVSWAWVATSRIDVAISSVALASESKWLCCDCDKSPLLLLR